MKSMKNIVFLIVVVAIIGLQGIYIATIYKSDREKIAAKQAEVVQTTQQLQELEERLKNAENTKKELATLEAQKTAMYNTVPSVSVHQKEKLDIIRYLQLNDFYNVKFTEIENSGSQVATQDEGTMISQHDYEITFETTYSKLETFIDNLNKAYQVVNINDFSFDNSIQEGLDKDEEKLLIYTSLFGEDHLNELVTATVQFSLYSRPDDNEEVEIYIPSQDVRSNVNQPFAKRQQIETASNSGTINTAASTNSDITGSSEQLQPQSTEQTQPSSIAGTFIVNVGDILTSGDTYSISGPGGTAQSYVGLVSDKDVVLTINVKEDGYELTVEDAETGDVKQTQVATLISSPVLNINSSMRQLQDVMPNVRIYVKNYTDELMTVNLKGSLLDNISIYNEFDELVTKGETKGNIKLT